jgi:hypothetical protein
MVPNHARYQAALLPDNLTYLTQERVGCPYGEEEFRNHSVTRGRPLENRQASFSAGSAGRPAEAMEKNGKGDLSHRHREDEKQRERLSLTELTECTEENRNRLVDPGFREGPNTLFSLFPCVLCGSVVRFFFLELSGDAMKASFPPLRPPVDDPGESLNRGRCRLKERTLQSLTETAVPGTRYLPGARNRSSSVLSLRALRENVFLLSEEGGRSLETGPGR